jgi:O-antigen ligase
MRKASEHSQNTDSDLRLVGTEEPSRLSLAIVVLIYIALAFATIVYGGVDTGALSVLAMISAVIVGLWCALSWRRRSVKVSSNILQLSVAGLIVIGLIQLLPLSGGAASEIMNIEPVSSLSLDPYATRFFIIRLLVCLVFFAASLTFVDSGRRIRTLVIFIVIFGSLMAFFGILQFLARPDAIYGLRPSPQAIPFGPFMNQHHFAALMEMTSGLTLGILFAMKMTRDKKLLLAIAAVLMGISIVLTGSRGGMLSFMGVIAFVFVTGMQRKSNAQVAEADAASDRWRRRVAGIAAVSALVLVILGTVFFLGGGDAVFRGIGLHNVSDDVTSGRSRYWNIAVQIFLDSPVIGAGLDSFGVAFTRYDASNGSLRVEQAHNDYLQILSDAGILGFACVAVFIFFLFRQGLSLISNETDPFRRAAAIGALAGCFGILIHSFFDFPLRTPANAFFFLILVVIATVKVGPREA